MKVRGVLDVLRHHRAEGVGFEPTMRLTPHSGFQDRRHRPLGEPYADNDSAVTVEVTQRSSRARRELVLRGEPLPGSRTAGHASGQRSSGSRPRVSGSSQNSPMTSAAGRNVTTPATPNSCSALATAPKMTRPATAPSTPDAVDQPTTEARTEVGNNSLTSAPAAGAKTEAANTAEM